MLETHLKSSELFSILDPPTPGFLTIRLFSQAMLRKNTVMMIQHLAQLRRQLKEL